MKAELSKREKEVMQCLLSGYSNEMISQRLGLSVTTIKTYLRRLYVKLGVGSRLEAVAIYKKHNQNKK